MFKPVSSRVNLPELEEGILRFWQERRVFQRSVEERRGGPHFSFYEGPPTANGTPGVHHVLARVFKDVIPRYKTMKGYCVPRKGGWDTHGLPVELEVERELGLNSKAQIEDYGIARFNQRCRESVFRYVAEWRRMTERIGFWIDMDDPYVTLKNEYIEAVWWILKQLWDHGLIYQGYRVTPHCPRCGTSLSSHEVSQGYRDDADDPSVYIKFKTDPAMPRAQELCHSLGLDAARPAYLLAWTTTPWTLPGNTALAVAAEAEYAVVEGDGEYIIMARALLGEVGLKDAPVVATMSGSELVGVEYEPLYDPLRHGTPVERFTPGEPSPLPQAPVGKLRYRVIAADYVSLEEGTGMVHTAPAFGEVDFEAGRGQGLYFVRDYVDLQGNIVGEYPFSGKFVKDADPLILEELASRGLLYRSQRIVHTYPFCWRCETPLLYYAKRSWYVRTTARKERLISANREINWVPEHIKYGRFGDWLASNVDWALSRERYWGTPLNIWRCADCGHYESVGSLEELRARPGLDGLEEPLDLHRPFVDNITFSCPRCQGLMRRQPEVLDAWFDSGAMPVAQWHYPFETGGPLPPGFPADFICEAVDQTRGWFYSLHAEAVLLFEQPCFKNCICLGHIVDARGEKMSKSRGNVVDPWVVLNKQGADALRWYMITAVPAGNTLRFSASLVDEALRKFLLTLWNVYSFFVTYANIDRFDPASAMAPSELAELDRWVLSELNRLIVQVSREMDAYNPTEAGRHIEGFVDLLSNWYVRRSRRRFWKSENDLDKLAAYTTLYQTLVTLARLLAPLTPFIAEELYQNLVRSAFPEAAESVHLTEFPAADERHIDEGLSQDIRLAMRLSSLGRAARSRAGIKVRQPLAKVLVWPRSHQEWQALQRVKAQVVEELNVKELELPFPGQQSPEQFVNDPRWAVEMDGPHLALDTEITSELAAEGLARELVHRLQTMRRSAGFDIADYIYTYYRGDEDLKRIIQQFADYIKQETLSRELMEAAVEDAHWERHRLQGREIALGVRKASG